MLWGHIIIASIIIVCLLKLKNNNPEYLFMTGGYDNPEYLFMTGGYDSTFRLCQMVITEGVPVQPIYINVPKTDGDNVRRKNVEFEMKSMEKIINELRRMGYGHLIHPVKVITENNLSPQVKTAGFKFYNDGTFRRPLSQYVNMAEVSLRLGKPVDTGVLCDDNGAMTKTIGHLIDPKTKMIDLRKTNDIHKFIFKNLKST